MNTDRDIQLARERARENLAEDRWMSKFRWTVVEVLDTVAR